MKLVAAEGKALDQVLEESHRIWSDGLTRHAYARYKALLEKCDALTAWYAYEARATESALRQSCADNDLPLAD